MPSKVSLPPSGTAHGREVAAVRELRVARPGRPRLPPARRRPRPPAAAARARTRGVRRVQRASRVLDLRLRATRPAERRQRGRARPAPRRRHARTRARPRQASSSSTAIASQRSSSAAPVGSSSAAQRNMPCGTASPSCEALPGGATGRPRSSSNDRRAEQRREAAVLAEVDELALAGLVAMPERREGRERRGSCRRACRTTSSPSRPARRRAGASGTESRAAPAASGRSSRNRGCGPVKPKPDIATAITSGLSARRPS